MREIRTSGSTREGWIERQLRPSSYSTGSETITPEHAHPYNIVGDCSQEIAK